MRAPFYGIPEHATFADLGTPFRLFEAPARQASLWPPGPCCACGTDVPFRIQNGCLGCLSEGRISNRAIDTELGMIRPEDAAQGSTHGLPLPSAEALPGWPLVPQPIDPRFPDEHWHRVRVDKAELRRLLQTPMYSSLQGERWLFCCQKAMIYVGHRAPSPHAMADIADQLQLPVERLEQLAQDGCLYAFRCRGCGGHRAHWD